MVKYANASHNDTWKCKRKLTKRTTKDKNWLAQNGHSEYKTKEVVLRKNQQPNNSNNNNNDNRFTALCPELPRWADTRRNTYPPTILIITHLYQLLPSTTIHSILLVQIACLAIFLHNLSPRPFGLPLGLEPSTSYSIHFFTQSVYSFCSTCPYHCNLFCCSISIISSIPSLSLNSLLGTLSFTLTLHIHLTILISARWSATSFSFLTGQVSIPCSILLCTQLLYSLLIVTVRQHTGPRLLAAHWRIAEQSRPLHWVQRSTEQWRNSPATVCVVHIPRAGW